MIGCTCETCTSLDPRDNRLRTSILLEKGQTKVVIDSGPDFRQQMLKHQVNKLDALVFTHEHKDHTAGMDDVRAYNFTQNKPFDIWATERVEEALRNEFHYAFTETRYPGVPEISFHTISENAFTVGEIQFIPIQVMHHKLPVLGFRVDDFVYITDANFISETEFLKVLNAEVIVLNALRKTAHISHYTLDEAIQVAQASKAKSAYFTHISHQMGKHEQVSAELPEHIHLAYDGLVVEFN